MYRDEWRGVGNVVLTFQKMDKECATTICGWKYPEPYDVYNITESEVTQQIDYMVYDKNQFCSIYRGSELCGFISVGKDALVKGGNYQEEAIDVGMGLKPDITGKGTGAWYVSKVVEYIISEHKPERIRVTIAEFNNRAIKVWLKNEFQIVQKFVGGRNKQAFVVLIRTEAR
jgi:[ribosomal protein S18]-alanine N-acetyltransferase